VIHRSSPSSAGCARRRSPPTRTRTCRSNAWWRIWRRSAISAGRRWRR